MLIFHEIKKNYEKSNPLVPHNLEVPIPQVEVVPQSVIVHFPTKVNGKVLWQGLQLTPFEAMETGAMLLEASEMAQEKEMDS